MIMRATSGTTQDTPVLTPSQIASLLTQSVARADTYRVAVLGQAIAVLQGSVSALDLEQTRLTAIYGAASPQVAAVSRRLQLQSTLLQITTANLQRAQAPVPTVPQGGAAIFGRVVDATGAGIAALTVAALDAQDTVLARAVTDQNGAFSLSLTPARASARKGQDTESAAALEYRLQVTDAKQNVRYLDKQPSRVATGRLAHREVAATHSESEAAAGTRPSTGSRSARRAKRGTTRPRKAK